MGAHFPQPARLLHASDVSLLPSQPAAPFQNALLLNGDVPILRLAYDKSVWLLFKFPQESFPFNERFEQLGECAS